MRNENQEILDLAEQILEHFTESDWSKLGLILDEASLISGHSRLLRSLKFGDDDYEKCIYEILIELRKLDTRNLSRVQSYLNERYPSKPRNISSTPKPETIVFSPDVFSVPKEPQERDLVAVMMPFSAEFNPVYDAIKEATHSTSFRCERVDEIWKESTIIQDIFGLIYRSHLVIADLSDRNPNVFYEAGIAHSLGRTVIPIAQSKNDVPFDLQHHRFKKYLPNREGLATLTKELEHKLSQYSPPTSYGF